MEYSRLSSWTRLTARGKNRDVAKTFSQRLKDALKLRPLTAGLKSRPFKDGLSPRFAEAASFQGYALHGSRALREDVERTAAPAGTAKVPCKREGREIYQAEKFTRFRRELPCLSHTPDRFSHRQQ